MKRTLLIVGGVVIVVVLVTLFVPGVSEFIEFQLLARLGAWAS